MTDKKSITVDLTAAYTGWLAIPVAFRRVSRYAVEYVKPMEKTVMRGGGAVRCVLTYADADIVLMLEQTSLTRRRYVTIYLCRTDRDLCHRLAELAEAVWRATGNPRLVVAKVLETYGAPTSRPTAQ
jgi:hypothetical protein